MYVSLGKFFFFFSGGAWGSWAGECSMYEKLTKYSPKVLKKVLSTFKVLKELIQTPL